MNVVIPLALFVPQTTHNLDVSDRKPLTYQLRQECQESLDNFGWKRIFSFDVLEI